MFAGLDSERVMFVDISIGVVVEEGGEGAGGACCGHGGIGWW